MVNRAGGVVFGVLGPVQVVALALPELLLEIDALAVVAAD